MPSLVVSAYALTILLVAALIHATWNFFLKKAKDKTVVTTWALPVIAACALPFILVGPPIPIDILPYALLSAVLEAAYYLTLTYAYGIGEFSMVYPTARGTSPLLLVVWSTVFLDQYPTALGVLGIGLMVLGIVIIGNASKKIGDLRYRNWPFVVALSVAVIISAYSVVDGKAVQTANPVSYTSLVFALTALFAFPLLWKLGGKRHMAKPERATIVVVGVFAFLAYVLVVSVYAIAPVVYVGSIREVSIVFGAILGWLLLKEEFGLTRTLGSVLIFAGILLIVFAGSIT
jgi:drug/metabolite transporter (DMT)-like permease